MRNEVLFSIDGRSILVDVVQPATQDQKAAWEAQEERRWAERRRIRDQFARRVTLIIFNEKASEIWGNVCLRLMDLPLPTDDGAWAERRP